MVRSRLQGFDQVRAMIPSVRGENPHVQIHVPGSRSAPHPLRVESLRRANQARGESDRGKSGATVLVRISHEAGFTLGTAFCIDKSGLFLSTAGVVEKASAKGGAIGLIFDGGLKTQKVRRAKLLRQDEDANPTWPCWRSLRNPV